MDERSGLQSLYQDLILHHYRKPENRGTLPDPDVEIRMNNPTCGDEITLQLRFAGDRIDTVRFAGQGCAISQASASMMAQKLEGSSIAEVDALHARFREMLHGDAAASRDRTLGDLRSLAGVAKFAPRVRCALLAWNALDEATKGRRGRPGE